MFARIFCAEQINVPAELPDILKALAPDRIRSTSRIPMLKKLSQDFTKAVIREDPSAGEADPAGTSPFLWVHPTDAPPTCEDCQANARMKLYQWSRDYFKKKLGEVRLLHAQLLQILFVQVKSSDERSCEAASAK